MEAPARNTSIPRFHSLQRHDLGGRFGIKKMRTTAGEPAAAVRAKFPLGDPL